jgi:GNAT superfamily N-acetyltransferase
MTVISEATVADRSDLLRLLGEQMREHHIAITPERLAAGVDSGLRGEHGRFLVARTDERVAGVAYYSFAWPLEAGGLVVWLEELYVDPPSRARGTGNQLVEAVIAVARATGALAVDLEVEESQRRVESLYGRHGFRPHTRRHWTLVL